MPTTAEIGRSDWTDLRVEVEVTVADRAGIALRRDGTGHVLVEIDASTGEVVVGQRVATAFTEIGRAPVGAATTLDLAVTAEGTRIGIEIGGDEVLVVEGPAASSGPIALGSAGPGAVFSGFAARSWPRTTVLSWPFTSSRYAGFAELAQAFTGDVFTEAVVPTADLAAAAAAGASFEELYALLGGLAVHRAAPRRRGSRCPSSSTGRARASRSCSRAPSRSTPIGSRSRGSPTGATSRPR